MGMKVCSRCGVEKPVTEFYKQKTGKDGLMGWCKVCTKQYRSDNKQHYQIINKAKYEYESDILKEYQRKYNEEHKEERVKYAKKYKSVNTEKIISARQAYYDKNKIQLSKYHKEWAKSNPVLAKTYGHKRRAKIRELPSTMTPESWNKALNYFGNKCCYCGKQLPLSQEHFIPVTKGGSYSEDNIIPACTSCNTSKRDRLFSDWYPKYKYYSKHREQAIINYLTQSHYGEQLTLEEVIV